MYLRSRVEMKLNRIARFGIDITVVVLVLLVFVTIIRQY